MARTSAKILLETARTWLQTRWRASRLVTREAIEQHRERHVRRFLDEVAPRAEAFRDLAGKPLEDFPRMDKARLMAGFHRYNRFGIRAEDAWAAMENGNTLHGCHVGASTGTSGNRGLYLVNPMERARWLGVMLAKTGIDILRTRQRVAILLPTNSQLYETANESGRLQLVFFDLNEGVAAHAEALSSFDPTVLVATPHVLSLLADMDIALNPEVIFSGAEVLDPTDRKKIETRFQRTVREIYMATEGLFAVACSHGRLHLTEDVMAFDWDSQPDLPGLLAPVITDFSRTSQIMVRYQMNDLLRLSDTPCPCGSALQVIDEIVGRRDDIFDLPGTDGRTSVTPDIIRNAIIRTSPRIEDFRVTQSGEAAIYLTLPEACADLTGDAAQALNTLFARLGANADITAHAAPLVSPQTRKLRRVVREWQGPA